MRLARRQVVEAKTLREEQARPYVVIDIQLSREEHNVLNLVIENIGRTLAKDVRMAFEPEIASTLDNGKQVRSSPMFRDGIATMPPRRRIEILFDLSHKRIDADLPMRYEVKVDVKDAKGVAQPPLSYTIDLSYLLHVSPRYETWKRQMSNATQAIPTALNSIGNQVDALTDSHGRVRVSLHQDNGGQAEAEWLESLARQSSEIATGTAVYPRPTRTRLHRGIRSVSQLAGYWMRRCWATFK